MFYEVVYETGRMSVAEYKDDEEAQTALMAHHLRAVKGQIGGPVGQPAERIAAVYVYDKHPDSYNEMQTASADVLEKEIGDLIKSLKDENGVVALDQLAIEVRSLSHPMLPAKEGFSSRYRMKETRQLVLETV